MTTINDVNDLVRILREQPDWAETIRSVLLSRELLNLPERFAEFVEATGRNFQLVHDRLDRLETDVAELKTDMAEVKADVAELKTDMAEVKADIAELKADVAELKTDMAEVKADVAELKTDVAGLKTGVESLNTRVDGIRRDIAPLRGAHARNGAVQATRRIARTVNCRQVSVLNEDDLYDMLDTNDVSDIEPRDIRSFENADIVIEARERDTGESQYLAVEASFTAHPEDIPRAVRNARFLTRFTGAPAIPVVASIHIHPDAQPEFETGDVRWFEIEARDIEPD